MMTLKFTNDEFSTQPCEGTFWIVGDLIICFTEPLHSLENSNISYLDYDNCWSYLRSLASNDSKFKDKSSDFYPRGKITIINNSGTSDHLYTAIIHLDRLLEDSIYTEYKRSIEHTFKIDRNSNDCELNYIYNCLF